MACRRAVGSYELLSRSAGCCVTLRWRDTWLVVRQMPVRVVLVADFNAWPMYGEEGQWGSIEIDVYVVMCQVLKPPSYKRRLNAPILLKVAGVGNHRTILRRLGEIEAESKER